MSRAVDAALVSAISSAEPFLAVGVLPKWRRKGYYHDYLHHPNCHVLTTIPKGYFHFSPACYSAPLPRWALSVDPAPLPTDSPPPAHAHWPLQLVLFYNAAGLSQLHDRIQDPDTYWHPLEETLRLHASGVAVPRDNESPGAFDARVRAAVSVFLPPPSVLPPCAQTLRWARRQGRRIFSDPVLPPPAAFVGRVSPLPPLLIPSVSTLPLALDPASLTYTDASQSGGGAPSGRSAAGAGPLGCGVFCPAIPPAHSDWPRELSFVVPACESNIVRGELSAILAAISTTGVPPDDPLHILTDSLTGLQLLQKHLRQPWLTTACPYRKLLQNILHAASERSGPTLIQKVRGHIGVRGNEAADALAKAGAAGKTPPPCALPEPEVTLPLFYVSVSAGPVDGTAGPADIAAGADAAPSDLDDRPPRPPDPATRADMLFSQVQSELLDSPSSSYAAKLAAQPSAPLFRFTSHCADILSKRPTSRLPASVRKVALQARYGVYPGQHRLHMLKKCSSPACPLCNYAFDTGFHGLLLCCNDKSLLSLACCQNYLRHDHSPPSCCGPHFCQRHPCRGQGGWLLFACQCRDPRSP